jgi:hypothetical protein
VKHLREGRRVGWGAPDLRGHNHPLVEVLENAEEEVETSLFPHLSERLMSPDLGKIL